MSKESGALNRDASSIFPVVLKGAEDTEDDCALLRAVWKERNRSRRPGGNIAISASSEPFIVNVVGDSVKPRSSVQGVTTGNGTSGVDVAGVSPIVSCG